MPESLRQFETLTEPVISPSGEWALRYHADGRAEISDRVGTATWTAGAVGTLRLEMESVFAVYQGDEVVWRADLPKLDYSSVRVTDDGDCVIYDEGLRGTACGTVRSNRCHWATGRPWRTSRAAVSSNRKTASAP